MAVAPGINDEGGLGSSMGTQVVGLALVHTAHQRGVLGLWPMHVGPCQLLALGHADAHYGVGGTLGSLGLKLSQRPWPTVATQMWQPHTG